MLGLHGCQSVYVSFNSLTSKWKKNRLEVPNEQNDMEIAVHSGPERHGFIYIGATEQAPLLLRTDLSRPPHE